METVGRTAWLSRLASLNLQERSDSRVPRLGFAKRSFPASCAITIDVHAGNEPHEIESAGDWLAARHIRATFFVVSRKFEDAASATALQQLLAEGHELASHSHNHDQREVRALLEGAESDLKFIHDSKHRFEDCFDASPNAFRSPRWCVLHRRAQRALVDAGYRVDSSATPQRPAILSSLPYDDTWMTSPRAPHYLAEGLLEVPTSCLLVPAAAATFTILRSLSSLFLEALVIESLFATERVMTLQFHPSDFSPVCAGGHRNRTVTLRDFWPQRYGGVRIRHALTERDPRKSRALMQGLITRLTEQAFSFDTITEAADKWRLRHQKPRLRAVVRDGLNFADAATTDGGQRPSDHDFGNLDELWASPRFVEGSGLMVEASHSSAL